MIKSINTNRYLLPFLIVIITYIVFHEVGLDIYFFVFACLILAILWIRYVKKQKKDAKKQLVKERNKRLEDYITVARLRYAGDNNVTFDPPNIHIRLKYETLPLLPMNPSHPEQLLLEENENLQITTSLCYLYRHIAYLKAKGRDAQYYTCIIDKMERVGIGLWKLKEDVGLYKSYRKEVIKNGLIHIWNKKTDTFETEMYFLRERTQNAFFVSSEEDSYSCGEFEFFKYQSRFF